MKALPHVDRETADSLRARQHSQQPADPSAVTVDALDASRSEPEDSDQHSIREPYKRGLLKNRDGNLAYPESTEPVENSCDDVSQKDASSSVSSSSDSAGFARSRHVIRLLSVAPYHAVSGSRTGSGGDSGRRAPAHSYELKSESREQAQEIDLTGARQNSVVRERLCDPSKPGGKVQTNPQQRDDAASAHPAAPHSGGLPGPDSRGASVRSSAECGAQVSGATQPTELQQRRTDGGASVGSRNDDGASATSSSGSSALASRRVKVVGYNPSGEARGSFASGRTDTDSTSAAAGSAHSGVRAPGDRRTGARRPIRSREAMAGEPAIWQREQLPQRQQNTQQQQQQRQQEQQISVKTRQLTAVGAGQPHGGDAGVAEKQLTVMGGRGGLVRMPPRRGPMHSLFWVLKQRTRDAASSADGVISFALVAEADRDGSMPCVCDPQGTFDGRDVRPSDGSPAESVCTSSTRDDVDSHSRMLVIWSRHALLFAGRLWMHVLPTLGQEAIGSDAGSVLVKSTLGLPSMGPFVLGAVSSWDCDAVVDQTTVSGLFLAAT